MKKRLLITGLRAPVALDLARQFNRSGWQVIAADSQHLPIGRLSNALQSYHRLPAAALDHHAYADAVADLIQRERIDVLLPTCEEAFFIARHKDKLSELCEVLTSDWQTMQFLHDKANVTEIVKGTDLNAPDTQRVTNVEEARADHQKHAGEIVLKKSFSRFARGVVIKPTADDLARLNYTDNWISQQFITGQEYCVYGFALNGELKAFCAYRPTFRLGTASSYYFENVADPILQKFAQDVCRKHHIHGQISFDIIKTGDHQYYLLECNPRATSAVHLFPATASLPQVFNDDQIEIITPPPAIKPCSPWRWFCSVCPVPLKGANLAVGGGHGVPRKTPFSARKTSARPWGSSSPWGKGYILPQNIAAIPSPPPPLIRNGMASRWINPPSYKDSTLCFTGKSLSRGPFMSKSSICGRTRSREVD